MNKTTEALKLAEALENDAKEHREVSYGLDCPPERTANWQHALNCEAAARLIREALAEQALQKLSDFHQYMEATEPKCSEHPDAPHGFDRNANHNAGRYVCECEAWSPEDMAYRPNGLSMDAQDQYEVGTLEDADILKQRIQELEQQNAALKAVIDAWNNVEPVKQEPVGVVESSEEWGVAGVLIAGLPIGTKLYAAPVERQWVDLTDDEIDGSWCIEPKPINGLLVAEPVKQEPVAVISESAIGLVKLHSNGACLPFGTPLYAAPVSAKREWVELEPWQLCEIEERIGLPIDSHDFETIGNAYIAAFKEKNNV